MKMVALLRGINVGGNRKVPMADLRAAAARAGLGEVRSYIQSGNIAFESGGKNARQALALLEGAILESFGFPVDVVVRGESRRREYAGGSPFPDAEKSRPNLLHLGLAKRPLDRDAAARLGERAGPGERIAVVGDAIWIDFARGAGTSKLTPAVLKKAAGSPVTLRNWNTVLRLNEMLEVRSFPKAAAELSRP